MPNRNKYGSTTLGIERSAYPYQSTVLSGLTNDQHIANLTTAPQGLAASSVGTPQLTYEQQVANARQGYNPLPLDDNQTVIRQGPSELMSNVLAGSQVGLGLASFLDSRKTSKLQRDALRQDIAATREYNDMKRSNRAAWNNAFANAGKQNTQV